MSRDGGSLWWWSTGTGVSRGGLGGGEGIGGGGLGITGYLGVVDV